MEERTSGLKLYSLGIVVEDKQRGSMLIKVNPVEELNLFNGPMDKHSVKHEVNLPNVKGVSKSEKIEGGSYIVAKWIPYGHSNRLSAPDVIKNETVLIFRFGDTHEYYWTTVFSEPKIRRLETVLYGFGNKKVPLDPWDKESSYWFEVSTHDKYIKLHTSKSDGEPFEYDITIDTGTGFIEMKDSVGNYIKLDSPSNSITAKANQDILLDAPTITLRANHVINDTPLVTNTGDEETTGVSRANPHIKGIQCSCP